MRPLALVLAGWTDAVLTACLATELKPLHYLTDVWPSQCYLLGQSTADLCAAALLRAVACSLIAVAVGCLSRRRAPPRPLVEPLNANVAPSDADCTDGAAESESDERTSASAVRLFMRVAWHQYTPASIALAFSFVKAVARLFEAGVPDPSAGVLPAAGTSPTALPFWLALGVGPLLVEVERRCARGSSGGRTAAELEKERRKRDDNDAGLDAANGDDEDDKDRDPAAEAKRAYLRRTTPAAGSVLRLAWRIFRPDVLYLLFGYASLCIAAAGEAAVPLLQRPNQTGRSHAKPNQTVPSQAMPSQTRPSQAKPSHTKPNPFRRCLCSMAASSTPPPSTRTRRPSDEMCCCSWAARR